MAIFEGGLDFLSLLSLHSAENPPHDVIILNSVSLLTELKQFINKKQFTELHCYFDNDQAGEKAFIGINNYFPEKLIIDHS